MFQAEELVHKEIAITEIKTIHAQDQFKLSELTQDEYGNIKSSIQKYGILQTLLVAKEGDKYLLLAGHNRLKIAKELGMKTVPCTVIISDAVEQSKNPVIMGLSTDIDRRQLKIIEHAELRKNIFEWEISQELQAKDLSGNDKSLDKNPTSGGKKTKKSTSQPSPDEDVVAALNKQIADLTIKVETLTKVKDKTDTRKKELEEEVNKIKDNVEESRYQKTKEVKDSLMTDDEFKKAEEDRLKEEKERNASIIKELKAAEEANEKIQTELRIATEALGTIKGSQNLILDHRRWTLIAKHNLDTIYEKFNEIQLCLEGPKDIHTKKEKGVLAQMNTLREIVEAEEVSVTIGEFTDYLTKVIVPLIEKAVAISKKIPVYPDVDPYEHLYEQAAAKVRDALPKKASDNNEAASASEEHAEENSNENTE